MVRSQHHRRPPNRLYTVRPCSAVEPTISESASSSQPPRNERDTKPNHLKSVTCQRKRKREKRKKSQIGICHCYKVEKLHREETPMSAYKYLVASGAEPGRPLVCDCKRRKKENTIVQRENAIGVVVSVLIMQIRQFKALSSSSSSSQLCTSRTARSKSASTASPDSEGSSLYTCTIRVGGVTSTAAFQSL